MQEKKKKNAKFKIRKEWIPKLINIYLSLATPLHDQRNSDCFLLEVCSWLKEDKLIQSF